MKRSRAPEVPIDPLDLTVQLKCINYVVEGYGSTVSMPDGSKKRMVDNAPVRPIIQMYGRTETGKSIMFHVSGFEPYLLCPRLPSHGSAANFYKKLMASQALSEGTKGTKGAVLVKNVEEVERSHIMYYNGDKLEPFWKITALLPNNVPTIRKVLEEPPFNLETCESNLDFVLRFMIDIDLGGSQWFKIRDDYHKTLVPLNETRCNLEYAVHYTGIEALSMDDVYSKIAPLRILSFDIECAGRKGHFPEPDKDPVIQIGNASWIYGTKETEIKKAIFTLKGCAPIEGATVSSHDREQDMLLAWRDYVNKFDPDILIGWNTDNFDLPYLLNRATALKLDSFAYFGRQIKNKVTMKDTTFQSKARGIRQSKEIDISGRLSFDMLKNVQIDYKLGSYTLNAVSAHFLGEQKEDVHHSIISELQNGDDTTRRRLAVYCIKDAYLPLRLMNKLMSLVNAIEMARVTGVPFDYLLKRGQQVKVISQLYRKAKKRKVTIPYTPQQEEVTYEGATVLEPKRGYYDKPVATLDFASLYPSIMQAHNLCYSTLLRYAEDMIRLGLTEEQVTRTPAGFIFVKMCMKMGLLPEILNDLIGARTAAKKDLKKETDPFKKAVLDGRQLALKVSANSVYGFTGATVGKLPCLQISQSVTAFGRQMIDSTKNQVESHYTVANGYPYDARVLYGDTDSVMVMFGNNDLEEVMKLGQEAADKVTTTFIKPIKLEFEKVYWPYLLINKKRYAGLYWTKPVAYDKLEKKGVESQRRDNCKLLREMMDTSLKMILIDRDVQGAIAYVKDQISKLLQGKIDISKLVISKSLSKFKYDAEQPHVWLAKKMAKRDAATAPVIGDRVPYVIIKGVKNAALYERAEDPLYALQNKLPIDSRYYLDNQLTLPLTRIFEPIMGDNVTSLFNGDHTRTITKSSAVIGALSNFVIVRESCLGCNNLLEKHEKILCVHCKPNILDIHMRLLNENNKATKISTALWNNCHNCQGQHHAPVLCSNCQCPHFYERESAKDRMTQCKTKFNKLSELEW